LREREYKGSINRSFVWTSRYYAPLDNSQDLPITI
jgi:hypothetical protein